MARERYCRRKKYLSSFHPLHINNHPQIILTKAKTTMIINTIIKRSNKGLISLLVLINGTIDITINNPILGAIVIILIEKLTIDTGNHKPRSSSENILLSRSWCPTQESLPQTGTPTSNKVTILATMRIQRFHR
jgi:hypothetical protein